MRCLISADIEISVIGNTATGRVVAACRAIRLGPDEIKRRIQCDDIAESGHRRRDKVILRRIAARIGYGRVCSACANCARTRPGEEWKRRSAAKKGWCRDRVGAVGAKLTAARLDV